MIPRFAQNGAAAASVISEALVTVCCVCFSVKHIQVRLRRGYLAKTVIAVAFMGGTYMDCHEHGKWRISAACSNSSDRGGLIFCFMHYASQSSLHGV